MFMKRQRGQSAVEFALVLPMIMLLIFGAIYGGAMFIQFLNYNNEARTIARTIAVAPVSQRTALLDKYNGVAQGSFGTLYKVTLTTQLIKDNVDVTESAPDTATDVHVRFDFDHGQDFPFDFPPRHFAASYHMLLEKKSGDE